MNKIMDNNVIIINNSCNVRVRFKRDFYNGLILKMSLNEENIVYLQVFVLIVII